MQFKRKPTLAIVIQGPLRSTGNSGKGVHVKDFNCIPNIKRIIKQYQKLVSGFVLSTWADDYDHSLAPTSKFRIVLNEDPGVTETLTHNLGNNDSRQAFSSLIGIREAIDLFNPDYLIKLRTDQYVDINQLFLHMQRTDNLYRDYRTMGQAGFIYFPNMLRYSPYSVGDFYIGARAPELEKFFTASVRYAQHCFLDYFPWVHSEIIHKHIYFNIRRYLQNIDCNLPPKMDNNLNSASTRRFAKVRYPYQILDAWSATMRNSISIFPRKIFDSLIWRGEKFDHSAHIVDSCFDEWLTARQNPHMWHIDKYPKIFKYRKNLTHFHKLKYFSKEKFLELELGYVPVTRGFYAFLTRFFLLISGEYLFHDKIHDWTGSWKRYAKLVLKLPRRFGKLLTGFYADRKAH